MSELIAEVFKIEEILVHENADKLEIIPFKGWRTVVVKGMFKVGEMAVHIPIDCIMTLELSDKLGVTKYLASHNRVRAASIRGAKSFGIVAKIDILKDPDKRKIGENVAEELELMKYEIDDFSGPHHGKNGKRTPQKPWSLISSIKYIFSSWHNIVDRYNIVKSKPWLKGFGCPTYDLSLPGYPEFIKYTDMANLRYYPNILKGLEVVVSEKTHGKNCRFGYVKNKFLVGSHAVNRLEWQKDEFWQASKIYPLKNILKNGMILFGELYGKGVQKTMEYGLEYKDIVFFDLVIDGEYVDYDVFQEFCISNNLPYAPYIYRGIYDYDLIAKLGEGNSFLTDEHIKEGVVVKTAKETNHPNFGRLIYKYVNEDYSIGNYDGYNH